MTLQMKDYDRFFNLIPNSAIVIITILKKILNFQFSINVLLFLDLPQSNYVCWGCSTICEKNAHQLCHVQREKKNTQASTWDFNIHT